MTPTAERDRHDAAAAGLAPATRVRAATTSTPAQAVGGGDTHGLGAHGPGAPEPASGSPIPPPPISRIVRRIWADLQPSDGRWALAWRMAALCALTALVFMTYQIPLAAIGCYLIFFVLKSEPTESILMGIAVIILVSVVVALLFLISHFALEHPVWRLAVIVIASMLFMFLGVASQVGPVGSILALIMAFTVTLFSDVPLGEALTRGLLYAWLMAATPMAVLIVFNAFLGRSPAPLLRRELAERLSVCADVLAEPDNHQARQALQEALAAGNAELDKRAMLLRLFHVRSRRETRYLGVAVSASYQAMLATAAWHEATGGAESEHPHSPRHTASAAEPSSAPLNAASPNPPQLDLAEALRQRAAALRQGATPAWTDRDLVGGPHADLAPPDTAWAEMALRRAIDRLAGDLETLADDQPAKPPFFAPDAWTNPDYSRYALKTTAAAIIAYLVYTAIDWQDIHTAMITCYVAALATTAETIHKLTLRILGCLLGAALGIGAVHYVIPHMTGVGELTILVFVGCLLAAWVATGPERIAYAGVQIALAFLLTVLQGFGPDPEVSVAVDRIIGILLGNLLLFLVFTQIWPASVTQACRRRLTQAGLDLQRLLSLPSSHERQRTAAAAALQQTLGQTRETLALAMFEPRAQRPDRATWTQLHDALDEASRLASLASLAPERLPARWQARVDAWQHQLSAITHGQK